MLNGHMDTVGVAGMTDPFSARVADNKMYGRGAFDMKGGVAACLWAASQAKLRGIRGDVIVTCVADEEVASLGTQAVLDTWRADAAIVTESTALDLCVAHKGFVWLPSRRPGASCLAYTISTRAWRLARRILCLARAPSTYP